MVRLRPNSTECGSRISAAPAHAPLVIRTQPIVAAWRCRCRLGEVQIYRVIAIAQKRPDHCAARTLDEFNDERVAIIGLGCEIAAKIGFRIGHEKPGM
ncbi:MAG: hypothetical protein CM15mP55_1240 [Hyphomicrobiales bacterium]|nr:MAG: hypothetical protein CM15mP55_1240 [Hyphomicrobiales bacterium]